MANKVGALIREARTGAGLTQEQLAKKIEGLTAADISKAERGEKELSQARLKEIAKATGVTQTSLLNAAKEDAAGKTATAAKTASGKTSSAAKPSSSGKTGTSSGKKTGTASDSGLTAAEKKLLEAYRAAGADAKKNALKILKGEDLEMADIMKLLKLDSKLENLDSNGLLGGLKEGILGGLLGKK